MRWFWRILFIFFTLGFHPLYSQAWMKELEEIKKSTGVEPDLPSIQKAFKNYWDNKPIEKGKGWKQFKRWENFMEPRVYPHGNLQLINPATVSGIQGTVSAEPDFSSWESNGPFDVPLKSGGSKKSGAGRINCIAFHPWDSLTMWAGSPSGGLWKTTNGGNSWITTTDHLHSLGVSDIAVHPINPDIIYIATGDGDAADTYSAGILKSLDGGLTWASTSVSLQQSELIFFRRILIHPDIPDVLIAASNKGIYRTEDGFNSHTLALPGHFKDLEFRPGKPDVVYATEYNDRGFASVYRSDNSGISFFQIINGMDISGKVNRIELAVTPADPNLLMALCSDASDDGFYALFTSIDGGLNWTKTYSKSQKNLLGWSINGSDEGGQGWYDLALAISPTDKNLVYVGGVNIWRSLDGGKSFSINAHWIGSGNIDYVHADHHMLSHNLQTKQLYSCNDGGIYVSRNNGQDWTDISDGLSILQIYKIASTESIRSYFLAGNQDNGTMKMEDSVWTEIFGGDGMECGIDPSNPDIIYVSVYNGRFFRSYDRGELFTEISPVEAGTGAWITPFLINPENPSTLYAAYEDVYKSDNRGETWYAISNSLSVGQKLRSLAVSEMNADFIYTATYRNIWMTENRGQNWREISSGLPNLAITSLTVSPYNPHELWITLSGYNTLNKVYYTKDMGKTWINFSEGLPNVPVNCLVIQKKSDRALYAGTDLGVYFRKHGMTEWIPFNTGLPNVIVNDLEIQYTFNRILAGTYGRSLWNSGIYQPSASDLYAFINNPDKYICVNDTVEFSAITPETFDSLVWNLNDKQFVLYENNNLQVVFEEPGIIDVTLTIYNNGQSFSSIIQAYYEVVEAPDLSITAYIPGSLFPGDEAILSAHGANEYHWEPEDIFNDPNSPTVIATPTETVEVILTGFIGKCVQTDTFRIDVRQGPLNDDVCQALEITTGLNGPFTNRGATVQPNEPLPDTSDCNTQHTWCYEGGLHNTVWFTFIAGSDPVSITTKGFDTQIALYKADTCTDLLSGSFTLVAANDDYFGEEEDYAAAIELTQLVEGARYWLQVDGSAGGAIGEFYITVSLFPISVERLEIDPTGEIIIFPNPNNGNFFIKSLSGNTKLNISVTDLSGRIVYQETNIEVNVNREIPVNIKQKGVYIVSLQTPSWKTSRKIIVY